MIYDSINNLIKYANVNDSFSGIIDFINSNDMANLKGSFDVCEGVTVNISEYEPSNNDKFEYHKCFHDLQYAIKGNEIIEVVPTDKGLNPDGYKFDIDFFSDKCCNSTSVALDEGMFVFLTPDDAHKPCIKADSDTIIKAVFKIKI